MQALLLSHKRKDVRDTAKYPPLMKVQVRSSWRGSPATAGVARSCWQLTGSPATCIQRSYHYAVHPAKNAALQARTGKLKSRALRHLASEVLGLSIQEGEHSPVDDARAALYLYLKHRKVRGMPRRLPLLQACCMLWAGVSLPILPIVNLPQRPVAFVVQEWERWLAAGGKQQQHPAVAKMLAETAARTGMFVTHAGKKETVALSLTELAARDIMSDL